MAPEMAAGNLSIASTYVPGPRLIGTAERMKIAAEHTATGQIGRQVDSASRCHESGAAGEKIGVSLSHRDDGGIFHQDAAKRAIAEWLEADSSMLGRQLADHPQEERTGAWRKTFEHSLTGHVLLSPKAPRVMTMRRRATRRLDRRGRTKLNRTLQG